MRDALKSTAPGLLALVLLLACLYSPLDASTKSEAALRQQLADAQAQILKLSQTNAARSASAARQTANVRAAQNENAGKAQDAVSDAQDAVTRADEANTIAVAAAVAAQMRSAVQSEQARAAAEATKSSNTTLQVTAVVGFLTLLLTSFVKIYADWQVQKETRAHRQTELSKIAEVGVQAKAAYTESNTVNQKIEHIGLQMKDGSSPKPQDAPAKPE